ncbi:hypothetical protein SDC9_127588 [bioreactor metagenome]|uniref:Uncharacterized protein n=1 Tax=bioreactor metagenome TaxID=1076179 RepID=A0A645CUH0_9ZZZZ
MVAVRVGKVTVNSAQLLCFFIHQLSKGLLGTRDMFGDDQRAVVARGDHRGFQQVFHLQLFAGDKADHAAVFRKAQYVLADGYDIPGIASLQSDHDCQYLGG